MQQNYRSARAALPEDIRDWLESLDVYYRIRDLSQRLNITDHRIRIIPDIIFSFVTKIIESSDFVPQIAIQLDISDNAAKAIAKEIETQIFHPIEQSLRENLGIEIDRLHFGSDVGPLPRFETPTSFSVLENPVSPSLQRAEQVTASPLPRQTPVTPLPTAHIAPTTTTKISDMNPPAMDSGPVILQTEREDVKPFTELPRQMFSIKIPANKKQYVSPPVTARIEISSASQNVGMTNSLPMRALSDVHPATTEQTRAPVMTKINMPDHREMHNVERRTIPKTDSIEKTPGHEHEKTLPSIRPTSQMTPMTTLPLIKKVVHYSEYRTTLKIHEV